MVTVSHLRLTTCLKVKRLCGYCFAIALMAPTSEQCTGNHETVTTKRTAGNFVGGMEGGREGERENLKPLR